MDAEQKINEQNSEFLINQIHDYWGNVSFEEFCTYVKIKGTCQYDGSALIPIDISADYKKRMIKAYDNHKFNIVFKFRQGGFTIFNLVWSLWKAMTQPNCNIMIAEYFIPRNLRFKLAEIIDNFKELKPFVKKQTKSKKTISFNNGSQIDFSNNFRGSNTNYLIIKEGACVKDMEDLLGGSLFPLNCNVIICSNQSANEFNDWFWKMCQAPGQPMFNVVPTHPLEQPWYMKNHEE